MSSRRRTIAVAASIVLCEALLVAFVVLRYQGPNGDDDHPITLQAGLTAVLVVMNTGLLIVTLVVSFLVTLWKRRTGRA